ncbi:hypothetical protein C9374_006684 [Naegleria lovaniensis]|uniref:N-acetyltransferase domain-containing protein n=1 Tax=Naegleria lovaniensis TaxID=51637 RepID=A0AA88GHK2_NAELO|nr:uncharacterized protein C9374_006684 [Naegleria lovaniensis]KAG2379567.1 hypothetical protein C9374_006684 [Naegleria lovaniensis]
MCLHSLSVDHNQDESIFHFKLNKSSSSGNDQDTSFFEWSILRLDKCGEWSGPLYFDFLSRNATFLKEHLKHYPPQAFTDLSFSINKTKVLSSPHNFFVFVRDPHHSFYEEFVVKKTTNAECHSNSPTVSELENHDDNNSELHMFLREHKIIGICGGKPNNGQSMEVGYALDEAFQSHGIVTNTLKVIIERAFHTIDCLKEIEIVCRTDNLRSAQVAHRLNFVFNEEKSKEVSLKENCDLHVYVLEK